MMKINYKIIAQLSVVMFSFALFSCSSGGGGGSSSCDMVANPNGPAYFKVVNNLNTGLSWQFENSYAFGADMKPGECTNMGVAASQYTIRLQQCNISDAACTSYIGTVKYETFTVAQGETHTLEINNGYF